MNPFILEPAGRLDDWKAFRRELPALDEKNQLQRVADYWALAPLRAFAYDAENPDSWPSPWEMVSDGEWCRNSVAIGMEFTLRLSGWSSDRLTLELVRDWDESEIILMLIIDDRLALNYSYADVVERPKTKQDVLGRWRFSGKFYGPIAV